MLLCDFTNLEDEVKRLVAAGVEALHLDVMDGRFVPNFTYGMPIVAALRRVTDLPLDVHLMIEEPERYIESFCDAGADAITIHIEALEQPARALASIRKLNMAAGVAFNPSTSITELEPCVGYCDLVLPMSVAAGFGGQKFNDVALSNLRKAREMFGEEVILEVDGGINRETIEDCRISGGQLFVVGSAIFKSSDYSTAVSELTQLAGNVTTHPHGR